MCINKIYFVSSPGVIHEYVENMCCLIQKVNNVTWEAVIAQNDSVITDEQIVSFHEQQLEHILNRFQTQPT